MGWELHTGGYIGLLLLISVCEQVLYMSLQGVSGSNALLASFFSTLLIISCPLFSGLPEAEGEREEATWRLGREVHLGFSGAEMKRLCFLDYIHCCSPPTAEEEGHRPHHLSAHMPPPLLMKGCPVSLEAPFVDPTDVCWVHSSSRATVTKYHELGG